ncbi:MAG: SCP2 sterol-binding domain-containing protein [Ktedonobacterales bacterium]|nr:SCP2 sterol-binding domain-containing protein [Ktedonobacterales bacterium]
MATREELREALDDYVAQASKSQRILQSLKGWNCIIYIEATDIGAGYTMTMQGGPASVADGSTASPDLIVRGSSEDLANIFWCDQNPASNYMQGAIKIQGSSENTMKLDAMSLMIYLEVSQAKG